MANTQMLILARESRGMTQTALAEESGISQGYISKAENGLIEPAYDKLQVLAATLGYDPAIFEQPETIQGVDALFHRKLKTVQVGKLRHAQAEINVRRIQIRRLCKGITVDAPNTFPRIDPEEAGGPAEVARLVRRAWKMPLGPVANLVGLLEAAGGIVVPMELPTGKVSAAAVWAREDERPMFFINRFHNAERHRFSLAHELAHMVMHTIPEPELEVQADAFASEFLMPAKESKPQLAAHRLNLARLIDIKQHWKVAISMVAKRAVDLEAITERQGRSLFQMLNSRGMLKKEPFPMPPEQPAMLATILDTHVRSHGYTLSELSKLAMVSEQEFARGFPVAPVRGLRAVS